jgi:hypothetical protein
MKLGNLRDNDSCTLCKQRRCDLPIMLRVFSLGMCQQCYASLSLFGGNRDIALTHVINKRLKGELRVKSRRNNG